MFSLLLDIMCKHLMYIKPSIYRSNENVFYERCLNDERYTIKFLRKVVEFDNAYKKVSDRIRLTFIFKAQKVMFYVRKII